MLEAENETASTQIFTRDDNKNSQEHFVKASSLVRASSGGGRFTGASTGSTFKQESEPKGQKQDNHAASAASREDSQFDRLAYLPPKVLDFLLRKGMQDPHEKLRIAYQSAIVNHTYRQRGAMIYFPITLEGEGEMVAVLRKNEKPYGRPWYLSYVGAPQAETGAEETKPEEQVQAPSQAQTLESFADIGYWQEFLKELAELAMPESWDFRWSREKGRYYILRKYMQYTFYRVWKEEKIAISEGNFAAFNTGLMDAKCQDIYACFVPNPKHDTLPSEPIWKFEAFTTPRMGSSKTGNSENRNRETSAKSLSSYFDPLPKAPVYLERAEDAVYDTSMDLEADLQEIILSNLERLPMEYLKECAFSDEEAGEYFAEIEEARTRDRKKQAYQMLSSYLERNDRLMRRMKARMEDAIELSMRKVRHNFRVCVPCYYPRENACAMLMPLALTEDTKTDAALMILRDPDCYRAVGILEKDNAYIMARIISGLTTEWLGSLDAGANAVKNDRERRETRPQETEKGETYRSDFGRVNGYRAARYQRQNPAGDP